MNSSGIMISNTKVPDELCDELINYFEFVQEQNPSTILSNEVVHNGATNRKDKSLFLDEINGELTYAINTYLNDAAKEYCDIYNTLYLNDGVIKSTKQKLQKTEIGGGFHTWHCEDTGISATNRVLVWTIYLNDVEEGGETEFLYHAYREKAEKGKICIFPANYMATHRGNPPISNEKYIATGWYTLYA
tara:strand:- start:200 stop:766 length:567 start_codon:yes stop_codon:yes gene_type:complete